MNRNHVSCQLTVADVYGENRDSTRILMPSVELIKEKRIAITIRFSPY